MALRSTLGNFVGLGFLRPRWGVRGSLFAAFAVIAGMAIVISAGATMVLGHLGSTMVDLSGRDIPRLAASLQLSAQSAGLASQGPALLTSRSEEGLNERAKKIKETQAVTLEKLGEVIELGADKAVIAALTETVKNIDETIKSLVAAAHERLEAAAQHDKQYDALRKARIYVESREAAMKESGDIIAAGQIFAEIGEVIAGSKNGRESDEEITLFKSVGVAVEDIVAADLVYRKHLAR